MHFGDVLVLVSPILAIVGFSIKFHNRKTRKQKARNVSIIDP